MLLVLPTAEHLIPLELQLGDSINILGLETTLKRIVMAG
jgi:hypothetical protein